MLTDFDTRGRLVAHAFFSELEKIAAEMGEGPEAGMLQGGVQNEPGMGQEILRNEASPAHGVIASRIQQLDPRRAVVVPVMEPPPGYVYSAELASFVPNEQDPGWMAQQEAIEAARNKGWYEQGQQDVVQGQAQQQLDETANAQVEQAAMEDQQAQQQVAMQQQAQQVAMMAGAKHQAKNQADLSQGIIPRPESGSKSSVKRPSSGVGSKGPAKPMTINIGR